MKRLAIALAATVAALATVAPASAQHGHRQHHNHHNHGHVFRHAQVHHHHVRPTYYGHSYHRPVVVHTPVYVKPVPVYVKPVPVIKTIEQFCVETIKDGYGRVWKKQIECKVEAPKAIVAEVPVVPGPPPAQEEVPQK
jgi:hypothetical protein